MHIELFKPSLLIPTLLVWLTGSLVAAEKPDSVEFFEKKIRPVLVKHCYECHSADAKEIGGSLVLDSSAGMMTGGDSGPAIKPADAAGSLLVAAIRYEATEMPPDGQLPDSVIHDFESWINAGAVDPRNDAVSQPIPRREIDIEAGREFWAFRPLEFKPPSSNSSSHRWVDQYLDDALAATDIQPNPAAPPAARLRRLAFDLTGLPPDQDLLSRWLAEPTPAHWQRIVDSLLASPGFAERWARNWMDVARYADSNGSDFNATFHEAWRYRDYLVRSFAADRPIDQMIRQQIAGDLLPAENDQQRYDNLVATTFLMLGTKMLSERDKPKLELDVVDEQIDTVGRAFLGLTLGCARCHDHKFDPVPNEDYYALAGIFKSTTTLKGESQKYVSTWNRVKLPTSAAHRAALAEHETQLTSLQSQLKQAEQRLKTANEKSPLRGIVVDDADAQKTGSWKPSTHFQHFIGPGYVHDDNKNKGEASIRFAAQLPKSGDYEVRIAYSPSSARASSVPVTIETAQGEINTELDQRQAPIAPIWRSLGTFKFDAAKAAAVTLRNEGTDGYVIADAVQFLATADAQTPTQPTVEPPDQTITEAQQAVERLKKQIQEHKTHAPSALPEAMAVADRDTNQIADSPVHIRGEVKNLGPVVPRGFLQVCSPGESSIRDPQGSGRLELADWLTDPDNALVARVFVNRVWMHLMGEGIVRTVDNFGSQGQRPTHPELLDALAIRFVRDGWRVKSLIREIVTSQAYQRSSTYNPQSIAADPENRLLWRMHRKRIPAESIRDTMLTVAGKLDYRPRFEQMKGRGTLVSSNDASSSAKIEGVEQAYRSVYLPVVRSYIPPLMLNLDVADPNMLVGRRPTTNVPSQALTLINSPEVHTWAEAAAERVLQLATGFDTRLQHVYLATLQRDPTDADRTIANEFFEHREDDVQAWREYIAGLFASTEFRLLD